MGIAAYNRGSALISRQIDADRRPIEFEIMDRLNSHPKLPKAPRPFGPIQFVQGNGGWWAECPVTGFGYWYPALREAVQSFKAEVIEHNNGTWLAVPWSASKAETA